MSDTPSRQLPDYIVGARSLLEYAVADTDVKRAGQALEAMGRAANAHGWQPFLDADACDSDCARLRELVTAAPELLGQAATCIAGWARGWRFESYGVSVVTEALYQRSGYQVLLDRATWEAPMHVGAWLDDNDDELAELIDALGLEALEEVERPSSVPPAHRWWLHAERRRQDLRAMRT